MALEKGKNFLAAAHQDCHYYKQLPRSAKGVEAGEEAGEEYFDTQELYN